MSKYSELADRLPCTTRIAIAGTRPCGRCDCCLAAAALRELEAENERLRKRRTEIDDEAFEYAGQVEAATARIAELERDAHQRRRVMKRYLPVLQRLGASPLVWETFTKGTGIATLNGYLTAIAGKEGE